MTFAGSGSQIERLYVYVVCLSVNLMLMDTNATFGGCPFGRCVKLSKKGRKCAKIPDFGGVSNFASCLQMWIKEKHQPTRKCKCKKQISSPNQEGNRNCSETKSVRRPRRGEVEKLEGEQITR